MHTVPTCNKICSETWIRQSQIKHRDRLKHVKADIDNKPPPTYKHLILRQKKEQMLEERYTQIEHENRLLLKKMSKIMRTPSLDNLKPPVQRSLNSFVRKEDLRKIMFENQQILKRIQERKPVYNREEFERHALTHSQYAMSIREKKVKLMLSESQRKLERSQSAPNSKSLRAGKPTQLEPIKMDKKAGVKKNKPTNRLSKGGFNIDGQYLIVTVEEHNIGAANHQLRFITYNMDSCEQLECSVPFAKIKKCVPTKLHARAKRSELSEAVVPFLSLEDGVLVFQKSAPPAAPAPAPEPGPEPAESAAESADEASEVNLSMKLSLTKSLEAAIDASIHLYAGDKFVAKTEAISITEGEQTFEAKFDVESKAASLQLKLFDGENAEPLATGDFNVTEGTFDVALSDAAFVIKVTSQSVATTTNIDLDETSYDSQA
jgi:hypothetical protein